MVKMNAADDKENTDRLNGTSSGVIPRTSSLNTEGAREKVNSRPVQVKLNGSSPQKNDCNKYPITIGAYPRANSAFSSVPTSRETGESQVLCNRPGSLQRDVCCGESEKDLNTASSSDNCLEDDHRQRQIKGRDKAACDDSSSEDEECCCIYTYKGDSNQMADLPSSFFRMDCMPSRPNAASGNSSPDMDYLEMDFDPGPSNDRFSSGDSESEDNAAQFPYLPQLPCRQPDPGVSVEHPPTPLSPLSTPSPVMSPRPSPAQFVYLSRLSNHQPDLEALPTPLSPLSTPSPVHSPRPSPVEYICLPQLPNPLPDLGAAVDPPPSSSMSSSGHDQPSTSDSSWNTLQAGHGPPLNSREGRQDPVQSSPCYCIANKATSTSIDENFNEGDDGAMIWKEQEAKEKQVNQIGTSLCGATAVINALLALDVPFTVSSVKQHVGTRFRANSAPVPEYLLSRSCAGTTHEDLIQGLHGASQGLVYARFFHMFPRRSISLANWLSYWIRKGAVPIVTLNLQRSPNAKLRGEIPDSWHHQMIYGVRQRDVYLTNPLETQAEDSLVPQVASPSQLLVRSEDVIHRWTPDTSLHPLINPSRPLWRKMNVLGQVVSLIRHSVSGQGSSSHCPEHICIPASYSGGVTIAMLKNSPAYQELLQTPELPVDHAAD